jgi:hypothetical protein
MKLVEKTSLEVYNLFLTNPQEALCDCAAGAGTDARRAAADCTAGEGSRAAQEGDCRGLEGAILKQAQAAIDAKQFDQAMQILESAAIEYGDDRTLRRC